jgi:tetratricopeptide (TPR) repeat protein
VYLPGQVGARCSIHLDLAHESVRCQNTCNAIKQNESNMDSRQTLSLAVKHHQAGNLGEAETLYRRVLQANPRNHDALHLLGVIANQLGRSDLAVDCIKQALRLHPGFPVAHNNLGIALRDQGKLDEAIACYQEALRLQPDNVEAHLNLGNALRDQGKHGEAIASYREALRLKPNNADAHFNLGNALNDLGKFDEAAASYQQALRLNPNDAETHNNLGNALRDQGKQSEAITSYQEALRLNPTYADAHSDQGVALIELGKLDDAIASFQAAIRLKPPHAQALCQLASVVRDKLPEADRAALEHRLAESNLKDIDRCMILFALGQVCDAKGEYEQAAALLRQANALTLAVRRQKGQDYDRAENARFVENLINAFTPAFFERMRDFGLETERPVFIVGLPRSGTTLTEQILAAHSQVFGAGELSLGRDGFLALGTQPTDDSVVATLPGLSGDAFGRLAQWHLDQLESMNRTAMRIVDKAPDNFFYLGLLAVLFPRAKFIHCRRDLRDVAVSCWMTNFRGYAWANDPESIAAHFRDYQRLMAHWRTVMPDSVLEVWYEETVADLPGVARRLVEWCGLDWEPACLKFNETDRPVRTASKVQVREPIYTRSVGRWWHYERELGELFATLKPLLDSG